MSAVTTPTNVSLIQRDASGDNQWIDLLGSANTNKAIGFNGSGVLAPLSAALVGAANTFTADQTIQGKLTVRAVVGTDANVTAAAIDWATGTSFYKTLAANTTFTFSNALPGQGITVAVTNTSGNYTVTWPGTIKWPNDSIPVQSIGARTDVYSFRNINGLVYGAVAQSAGGTESFANTQARLASVPYKLGLIGVQVDTLEVWVSIGVTAGDWQLVSGAGGVPPSHTHSFSEVHSLPTVAPSLTDTIGIPLGDAGGTLSHWASINLLLDLARVPRSGRDTLLSLNDAGVTLTDAQIVAINTFYQYVDAMGMISGNTSRSRLMLPVWASNMQANLLDWLHPASSSRPFIRNASTGANNAGDFTQPGGYIAPTGVTNSGMIDFDSTVAQVWEETDYSLTYYSHSPPLTDDNTMIGARNDAVSGGTNRWFTTSRSTTTPGVFRAAVGSTGGSLHVNLGLPELYVGGTVGALNPLGLIHFARKGTLFSTRRRLAAGIADTTDLTTSNTNANAIIRDNKLGGFLFYNGNTTGSLLGPGGILHNQPSSLFYIGRAIGTTGAATDTFSLMLFNLAIAMGAPSV
jgi:hypothetical protein